MTGLITKLLGLSAYTGLVAITLPHLQTLNLPSPSLKCLPQNYTTQIVSIDPLVIYIHNFLSESDIPALLAAGEPAFKPSYVYKDGRRQGTPDRTSSSAGLPLDDAAVRCVLARAERFMGARLGRDEMGPPQLVRYTAGQRFNVHHDWYDTFQPDRAGGRDRRWNRVASFFAILEDECVGGETWFPKVEAVAPQDKAKDGPWRRLEKGGLAFKPVRGNAVFWVNLHANGTGDERVVHAGLPLAEGLKTAMNIWPKRYIGPEAWGVMEKEIVVDEAETDPV
uniref:2og-fe oxygenase family protein n=1 Tax=Colletotrichum fructicola (strain Nara gc5) TaxID=1213859 RepID=L2G031_COLFN